MPLPFQLQADLRSHSICAGEILLLIDVDLGECDPVWTRELSSQLFVGRGDGFAWSAPFSPDCSYDSKRLSVQIRDK